MEKNRIIQIIEERIKSEHRKHFSHAPEEWALITAKKIFKTFDVKEKVPRCKICDIELPWEDKSFHPGYFCEQCIEDAKKVPEGFVYEDELPEDMTDDAYREWFDRSMIVGGVRMGPRI